MRSVRPWGVDASSNDGAGVVVVVVDCGGVRQRSIEHRSCGEPGGVSGDGAHVAAAAGPDISNLNLREGRAQISRLGTPVLR